MKNLILGICDSHDSGVSIIDSDGSIVFAVNEERFSRVKMASGFPYHSLDEIINKSIIKPSDIKAIGVAGFSFSTFGDSVFPMNNDFSDENGNYLLSQKIAELIDRIPFGIKLLSTKFALSVYQFLLKIRSPIRKLRIKKLLQKYGIDAPIYIFDHHDSHLAAAFYTSCFDNVLLFSNDGFGDGVCSKVAIKTTGDSNFRVINTNPFFNSIGVYYNIATLLCGFIKSHHVGKTTGLAAYGSCKNTINFFEKQISWDSKNGNYVNNGRIFRNAINHLRIKLSTFNREDIASGIQKHCENLLVSMIKFYINKTGIKNILLVGGVHANVKINQRISELDNIDNIFIFPNMGDGGLALGAAYLAGLKSFPNKIVPLNQPHFYLGSGFSSNDIHAEIIKSGLPFIEPDVNNYAFTVAKYLSENKIVARFNGLMEYGPRSLGNRSILYSANNPDVNKWLNEKLNRTEFMPFAPVLRFEDAPNFLINFDKKNSRASQFMTITFNVTDRCKKEAPAIVHVDGTARPQVLHREINPSFYDILTEYKKISGLSVLVNTSFNMHEEPIVCSPLDAIKSFVKSGIDILAIGNFIVFQKS